MGYQRPKFTNAGRQLQLRSMGGTEIRFTKMKVGAGQLAPGQDYRELTDLIDPKVNLVLTGIAIDDGYARIRGYFSNSGLVNPFNYRELGLFAQDPDNPDNEILYCYANYGEDYEYIAVPSSEIIERSVTIVAIIDDAENVTAVLDSSAEYATHDDVDASIAAHNSDPNAHPGLSGGDATRSYFINPSSTEDAAERTGSSTHPFKYMQEVKTQINADSAKRVGVNIMGTAETVLVNEGGATKTLELSGLVYFQMTGASGTYGTIGFSLKLNNITNVKLARLHFAPTSTGSGTYGLWLQDVAFAEVYQVEDERPSGTVDGFYLNTVGIARFISCTFLSPDTSHPAFDLRNVDQLSISGSSAEIPATVIKPFDARQSAVYCHVPNHSPNPFTNTDKSLYFDIDTMAKISDGSFKAHLSATGNPHGTTLTQVAAQGGTLDVAHGGTGKNTFTSGKLLMGNGSSAIAEVNGALPISKGGTGQTSWTQGAVAYFDGALSTQAQLPPSMGGTGVNVCAIDGNNKGSLKLGSMLICWGRVSGVTTTAVTESFGGPSFNGTNYVLMLDAKGKYTEIDAKNNASFAVKLASGIAGSQDVDYIAIGPLNP